MEAGPTTATTPPVATDSRLRGLVEYTHWMYGLHSLSVFTALFTAHAVALRFAFGLPSIRLQNRVFQPALAGFLAAPGPGLANVILDRDQMFEPKLSSRRLEDGRMSSSNLEDMSPFLSREELAENMIVPGK